MSTLTRRQLGRSLCGLPFTFAAGVEGDQHLFQRRQGQATEAVAERVVAAGPLSSDPVTPLLQGQGGQPDKVLAFI